jgi:hypothetical protein
MPPLRLDPVLVVTHYYAPVPAIVHNAIDWLTMRGMALSCTRSRMP